MTPTIQALDFHGLESFLLMAASGATAVVSRFGAQVLSWRPGPDGERLYLSERATFDGSAPIRGGIPICFPQFSNLGTLPKHGFARKRMWSPVAQNARDRFATLTLALEDDAATRAFWPHSFRTELTVALEDNRLDIELAVENTGSDALSFTGALHSYLRVQEVENARLQGLRGLEFRDAVRGDAIRVDRKPDLVVEEQVDRVYHNARAPLLLRDGKRSFGIQAQGFPDVVIWNPWETLAAQLKDMAAGDFRRMLCVEAAVARMPAAVQPGECWVGRQSLVAL
jgi:glucose-6-phosphate 1-epimerase